MQINQIKSNQIKSNEGYNISILYPHEEASFVSAEREGETSTRLTIFPSYTPFLRSLLPPHFLHFHSLPFPIFCCPSCLFYQWPIEKWQQPYWLAMPGAQLVCFLYNTTLPSKHLMFLGLQHLNIYHLKRHHNSVNLNFFNNVAKS
jgi:hypothetical protein